MRETANREIHEIGFPSPPQYGCPELCCSLTRIAVTKEFFSKARSRCACFVVEKRLFLHRGLGQVEGVLQADVARRRVMTPFHAARTADLNQAAIYFSIVVWDR